MQIMITITQNNRNPEMLPAQLNFVVEDAPGVLADWPGVGFTVDPSVALLQWRQKRRILVTGRLERLLEAAAGPGAP